MNKSSNRHMNIFESYTQSGNLPIENNISRIFAILLQEYPSLLMLFISKLNAKAAAKFSIPFPESEYVVDFQKRADDDAFGFVSKVIGITLTADEIQFADVSNTKEEDRQYITDISLLYDDTLIFIEAKRYSENCRKQVKEQIEKYKSSYENREEIADQVIDFTWKEVVLLLMEHKRLCDDRQGRLCDDYLSFLTNHFPNLAPVEPLNRLSFEREYEINSRLAQIKAVCCDDTQQLSIGGAIPIDSPFMSRCDVRYDKSFCIESKSFPCITVNVWPSDTVAQFWKLSDQINTDFFNAGFKKISTDRGEINVKITPYVKFAHFQRGVLWLFATKDPDAENWLSFSKTVVGRKKEASWEELCNSIARSDGFFSEQDLDHFQKDFDMIFKNRKSYADVSCGFKVTAWIPFEEAQKMEADSPQVLPDLVRACIRAFLKEMVK